MAVVYYSCNVVGSDATTGGVRPVGGAGVEASWECGRGPAGPRGVECAKQSRFGSAKFEVPGIEPRGSGSRSADFKLHTSNSNSAQNKANFRKGATVLSAIGGRGYGRSGRLWRPEKQSQFESGKRGVSSVKSEESRGRSGDFKLHTSNFKLRAEQSQFRGGQALRQAGGLERERESRFRGQAGGDAGRPG
jgi:hypothetical protein